MENRISAPSNALTRRRLLQGASGIAAAAAALMPPNVQRMLAQTQPQQPALKEIKHVVILMQENRSFDHYFGTMAGVRGFNDPNALKLATGKSVFYQPDAENPDGYMLPFHLDTLASSARAPVTISSGAVHSSGQWLRPPRLGTNTIATGAMLASWFVSWPAKLGSRR